MRWPSPAEYCETVQNPAICFGDPDLVAAEVERTPMGLPAPRSGASGTVFRLIRDDNTSWAVKCFTREIPGLMDRYAEVNRLLGEAKLPYSVRFEIVTKGIHIGNDWLPIVKMEWVAGDTLNVVVRNMLGDPEKLDKLSVIWARMNEVLEEKRLIHGDLQHGNVLMTRIDGKGAFKLVDYDGIAAYAATGSPADERGHPAYQHPDRTERNLFGPGVDRFSGLVIATAIRALRAGGRGLWDEFDDGQRLLFSEADLKCPFLSPVFDQCRKLDDLVARRLADTLAELCAQPLDRIPPLAEVLAEKKSVAVPAPVPQHWPAPAVVQWPNVPQPVAPVPRPPVVATLVPTPVVARPVQAVVVSESARADLEFNPSPKSSPRVTRRPKSKKKGPPPWAFAALAVAVAFLVVFFAFVVPQFRSAKTAPKDKGTAKDVAKDPPSDAPREKTPGKNAAGVPNVPPESTTPTEQLAFPASPTPAARLGAHAGRVTWVGVSADGKRAATTGDDRTVRVWDLERKVQVAELRGHTNITWTVALSRDGLRAYSGGQDSALFTWDVAGRTGYSLYTHATGSTVGRVDLSDDGSQVLSCAWDKQFVVWDAARGRRLMASGTTHPTQPPVVAFRPGHRNRLLFWDAGRDFQILSVPAAPSPTIVPKFFDGYVVDLIAASADGRWVTVGAGQRAQVADLDRLTPTIVATVPGPYTLRGGRSFTRGGGYVLLGNEETGPVLWDWRRGTKAIEVANPQGLKAFSAALVPDDSHAVVGYTDGSVRLWRLR